MINIEKNREINKELENLYASCTDEFLEKYTAAFSSDKNPPDRINEFGIIDESLYDSDCGIGAYFDKYIKNEVQKLGCKIIYMPHPAARRNKTQMIDNVRSQLENVPLN